MKPLDIGTAIMLLGCVSILFAYLDRKWFSDGNDATIAFWIGIAAVVVGAFV